MVDVGDEAQIAVPDTLACGVRAHVPVCASVVRPEQRQSRAAWDLGVLEAAVVRERSNPYHRPQLMY